jgi:flagellar basal-body rod protein FlgC
MIQGVFQIAASALSAEALRITLSSQNLANVDSITSPEGGPYRRRLPIFSSRQVMGEDGEPVGLGVATSAVLTDVSPPRKTYDPGNPLADEQGFVSKPSVNPVNEMVDILEASRVYQANLAAVESAKSAMLSAINLLS